MSATDLGLTADDVVAIARDLRTDGPLENPEYDRALVELTADLIGLSKELAKDLVLGHDHPLGL